MKKLLLFLLAFLPMALFTACSSSDDDNSNKDASSLKLSDISGVWKNGDYFVSFSSDNYYEAYLNDTLIDSGTFSLSGETVTCSNNYLDRKTTICISKTDKKLNCSISYTQNNVTKGLNYTFTKSDETPVSSEHKIVGRDYTRIAYWGNYLIDITANFITSNSGYEEITKGTQKGLKRNIYYVYLYPNIYLQTYQREDSQHGTNTFNQCKLNVRTMTVRTSSDGTIEFN